MRRIPFNQGWSVLFFVLLTAAPAFAKNCPSQLPANLRQVGEKELYWGIEFRTGQYFVREKDISVDPPQTNNVFNGFGAVRSIVTYTPDDSMSWLNLYFEGEVKQRRDVANCNAWAISYKNGMETVPQLRGLSLSMDKWDMNVKLGRQNLVFGTQSILDNFFDAVKVSKKLSKKVTFELFGGVMATELTRETLGCGYEQYYEKRKSWKRLCSAGYGDYLMAGAVLNIKHFRPHKISLMNLFQYSRLDGQPADTTTLPAAYPENLTTNFLSLYAMGPLLGSESTSYEAELSGAYKIHDQSFIPALSLGIRHRIKIGGAHLVLHPMYSGAITTSDSDLHFASLFEGYDVGSRQRYGMYDGQVFSMMLRLRYRSIRFDTGYHYHTDRDPRDSIDDELEAGLTWFIWGKTKYQFRAIYSLINLAAGSLPLSHGARVVLRLIY
ncbi:hypothetical protein KKF84_00325 [Myxococcota bacterium]|nr:hypothetical protein [Myxococcota bacterium]MBU1533729.1 hypothetical protein [Myxococcota bacterium]